MPKRILLAGATGLVGRECLVLLLADQSSPRVTAIVRQPLPEAPASDRLTIAAVDFEDLSAHRSLFEVDAIICALGTTMRKAGSEAAFRQVDFAYPLQIAELGREAGARQYLLVSALGASAASRVFYNRVKGELEEAIAGLGYPSVTIVRPSLLLGDRQEIRPGEVVGKWLGLLAPPRWRPVNARQVARALVNSARGGRPGLVVLENAELRR